MQAAMTMCSLGIFGGALSTTNIIMVMARSHVLCGIIAIAFIFSNRPERAGGHPREIKVSKQLHVMTIFMSTFITDDDDVSAIEVNEFYRRTDDDNAP